MCNSPGYSGTRSVNEAGMELTKIHLTFCFIETGSYYVVPVILELDMQSKLVLNSQSHHTRPALPVYNRFL